MKNLFICTFLVFLYGCANVQAPTGGDKDVIPPTLEVAVPKNFSVNFKSKKIVLVFDEYFSFSNLQSIIVTPKIDLKDKIKQRKKRLEITLPDSLLPNTTFTINFGESIKDINEGNILKNFSYVFSTGTYLDSLSIGGKIVTALENTPQKGVGVYLYEVKESDTVIYHKQPTYFTKTLEDGIFSINNLPEQEYKIFTLNDKNNNYIFDNFEEEIGFIDTSIILKKSLTLNPIYLFASQNPDKKINKVALNKDGSIFISLTQPPNSKPKIEILFPSEINSKYQKITEFDSILFWIDPIINDSINFNLTIPEWDLDTNITTRNINTIEKNKINSFNLKSNIVGNRLKPNSSLILTSEKPFKLWDSTGFTFTVDSQALKIETNTSNKLNNQLIINNLYKTNTKYKLNIPDSTVADIYGNYNTISEFNFQIFDKTELGTLKLNLDPKYLNSNNYIIELIKISSKIKTHQINTSTLKRKFIYLENLMPGKYKIQIIQDSNNNKSWTTGNLITGKQPELVRKLSEPLEIRPNWDLEIEINFMF
ncbi:MAG: hypothetical protein ACI81S_000543 [Sphingobacteriales bacterium]|jgi:hypothetical protein